MTSTTDTIYDVRSRLMIMRSEVSASVRSDDRPQPEVGQPGFAAWSARVQAVQALHATIAAAIDQAGAIIDLETALR
jgi:hypothetical protein